MNENICQLRLDFEEMKISGPNEESSLCEEDTFTVVGTAGENPRVICGENTGQHSNHLFKLLLQFIFVFQI